jgi:hypothetical protein
MGCREGKKKYDSVSQVQKGCPTMGLMIVFQKIFLCRGFNEAKGFKTI